MEVTKVEETRLTERRRQRYEEFAKLRMQRRTLEECSSALGVSVRQLQRWSKDPTYISVWRELQSMYLELAQGQVVYAGELSIETLMLLMQHARSEHVRFEAAKAVGDWAGLGKKDFEVQQDDRVELERLYRLMKAQQAELAPTVNVTLPPGSTIQTPSALAQPALVGEAREIVGEEAVGGG